MPERWSVSSREEVPAITREEQDGAAEERAAWTAWDAYAYKGGQVDTPGDEVHWQMTSRWLHPLLRWATTILYSLRPHWTMRRLHNPRETPHHM